jgi:hypothetical protein
MGCSSSYVDKRTGAVAWGDDIDLDPYTLYYNLLGQKIV